MKPQAKALTILDRFMSKRTNKPFQAIKRTDDYKKFYTMFADAIKSQADWTSKNLDKLFQSAGVEDDLEPLTLEQIAKIKGQLVRDMPGMDSFVTVYNTFESLKSFFEFNAKYQYRRWGYMVKATGMEFELTNPKYINALKKRADYLLNQSSLDQTTRDQIIDEIMDGKLNGLTNAEVASILSDNFDEISQARADMIARTEASNAAGSANYATMVENGVKTKSWVTAGSKPCEICIGNESDGEIPLDQPFSSGDMNEPAHPNDECYTEAGEIPLDNISIWDGS